MKLNLLSLLALSIFLLGLSPQTQARKVLAGLDFQQGDWAIIGVPLHNYKALPIQEELGTFITRNKSFMQSIQRVWDFPMTLSDDCDHHYALKIYRDGELMRTLEMNLHCGYVSLNGLSYTIDPIEFEKFRKHAKSIPWSRITFSDPSMLKTAIEVLETQKDVYWYEDISPYKFTGYFMLNLDGLAWNINTDSLSQVVRKKIVEKAGTQNFYLKEYFRYTHDKVMDIRYLVNCEPSLATQLTKYQYLPWRAHIPNKLSEIHILALGIDEKSFRELMGQD